jgi:hypothetical protein
MADDRHQMRGEFGDAAHALLMVGNGETEDSMESAGQQVGRIETRLRQLNTRLDRLVAKADLAGTEVKADLRKQVDHAKEKHAVVQSKLGAFRAGNGEQWDHFKGGVEVAWRDLEDALKAIEA